MGAYGIEAATFDIARRVGKMGSIGLGGQAIANSGNENRLNRGNRSCGYVGQKQHNEAIAIWPDSI